MFLMLHTFVICSVLAVTSSIHLLEMKDNAIILRLSTVIKHCKELQ